MGKFQDLTGKKFGRLTVLYRSPKNTNDGKPSWVCQCECGNTTTTAASLLKNGSKKSCGCLYWDAIKRRHNAGAKKHKLFGLYTQIKVRCYCTTDSHYYQYGARGIRMADEWINDFWEFAHYLEQLPHYGEPGYSIDRINVNGDYAPGNIRWATGKEQANNRRTNNLVSAFGETKTISEWADIAGMNYYTLWSRINKTKMPPEMAITLSTSTRRRGSDNNVGIQKH